MNKYSDEYIAFLKAKLLSTTTTVVMATTSATEARKAPGAEAIEMSKEAVARIHLLRDSDTLMSIMDLGYKPSDEEIEGAVFKVEEDIRKKMEECGLLKDI